MSLALSLLAFLLLTAGTALFVAAEFSLTALERSTVEANANVRWMGFARGVVRGLAITHETFTTDDVWDQFHRGHRGPWDHPVISRRFFAPAVSA